MHDPRVRVGLLLGIAFLATFLVYRQSHMARQPGVGQKASWNWIVTDLRGERVDLSELRGKPVFLNLWATWCPPCVSELPSIARLARDPKIEAAGVQVVCISMGEDQADVRDFLESRPDNLGGPRYLVASQAPEPPFLTQGIPATFLIAPDGRIVESRVGMDDWARPEVIDRVAALAGSSGPGPVIKEDAGP